MPEEITRDSEVRRSSIALWFGALAGPAAFAVDLQTRYALDQYVCLNHAGCIMWLITICAMVVAVIGCLTSWRHHGSPDRRIHFMAGAGAAISATFALGIIAMALPDLFLRACD